MPYTPRPLKRRKWGGETGKDWMERRDKGGNLKKLEKNGMRCKKKKNRACRWSNYKSG